MDDNQIDNACVQLQEKINELLTRRAELRKQEKNFRVRSSVFSSQPVIPGSADSLKKVLSSILPAHMMPGNVGDVNSVAWPFYYPFQFDFGTDPTLTSLSRQERNQQVSQEAGFLLLGISKNFEQQDSESGFLGPYQIDIRDNQSTRQFNDNPLPIQCIGEDSRPTEFATPLLFLPNASIKITASTWLATGETLATVGSGSFEVCLYGLRVRIEDAASVLGTIFA